MSIEIGDGRFSGLDANGMKVEAGCSVSVRSNRLGSDGRTWEPVLDGSGCVQSVNEDEAEVIWEGFGPDVDHMVAMTARTLDLVVHTGRGQVGLRPRVYDSLLHEFMEHGADERGDLEVVRGVDAVVAR